MDNNNLENINKEINSNIEEKEYITKKEATEFKNILKKCIKSYKEKDESVTDKEWLKSLFKSELPEMDDEEIELSSSEIISSISEFDKNLDSINKAAEKGISKESWLENKIQEASVGLSINEYGHILQGMDNILYEKNLELHNALTRSSDGNIKMSPNLDGNIAENFIAKTTELSGHLQGKNIKIEVRDVFTSNSVDVRATNLETGKYQNYQLKFGKDAKATIDLIERGNYNNQKIVVPTEQLEEVKQYFKDKGSKKTITDHIDAWGAKGKKYTKAEMKELQNLAQKDGIMPTMDYSHYQTKDLAISIGKNAGVMALQSAAITTGLDIATRIFNGEEVDSDQMIEIALKTGADTSIKVISAGALQVAIRKGIISVIPKMTPAGVIANIACVGIENIKVLGKIASGEITLTKGLDQMGRITTSMIGGLYCMGKGAAIGAALTAWIPVLGPPLSVVTGMLGGMVGYFAGSKTGEKIYNGCKKIANTAKTVSTTAWNGLKSVGRSITNGVRSLGRRIFG